MAFCVRHLEVLQAREVPANKAGANQSVRSDVAISSIGPANKSVRIEGIPGCNFVHLRVDSRGVGTIEKGTRIRGAGGIRDGERKARLDRNDDAESVHLAQWQFFCDTIPETRLGLIKRQSSHH